MLLLSNLHLLVALLYVAVPGTYASVLSVRKNSNACTATFGATCDRTAVGGDLCCKKMACGDQNTCCVDHNGACKRANGVDWCCDPNEVCDKNSRTCKPFVPCANRSPTLYPTCDGKDCCPEGKMCIGTQCAKCIVTDASCLNAKGKLVDAPCCDPQAKCVGGTCKKCPQLGQSFCSDNTCCGPPPFNVCKTGGGCCSMGLGPCTTTADCCAGQGFICLARGCLTDQRCGDFGVKQCGNLCCKSQDAVCSQSDGSPPCCIPSGKSCSTDHRCCSNQQFCSGGATTCP